MHKDLISTFLCFANFKTFQFSNLNLIQNKFGIFVFAKILQNKDENKSGNRYAEILIEYSIMFTEYIALHGGFRNMKIV